MDCSKDFKVAKGLKATFQVGGQVVVDWPVQLVWDGPGSARTTCGGADFPGEHGRFSLDYGCLLTLLWERLFSQSLSQMVSACSDIRGYQQVARSYSRAVFGRGHEEVRLSDQLSEHGTHCKPAYSLCMSCVLSKFEYVAMTSLQSLLTSSLSIEFFSCTDKSSAAMDQVWDPEYRKALALPGSRFTSSFHPGSYSILGDIGNLIGCSHVQARQDKLNMYGEGDFFKPHVDTPDDEGMFATLIVCLPCWHTGGELVIKHGNATATTDWAAHSQRYVAQWVAFYSDCLHEVRRAFMLQADQCASN